MSEKQKQDVVQMRIDGMRMKDISKETGLGLSVIKTLCAKHSIKPGSKVCANCFSQIPPYHSRFCSKECSSNWWRLHRKEQPHKEYHFVCEHCHKNSLSIGMTILNIAHTSVI